MDFPGNIVTPTHVHTWSRESPTVHNYRYAVSTFSSTSITWPAANAAIYVPISLPYPYPVNRVFWVNGSTGGANVDFGIYTPGGTRIYSTTSTAQSGTNVVQYVTPSTTFTLAPGRYLFALSCSGTTNTVYGVAPTAVADVLRLSGLLEQTSALPLPATATFAALSDKAIPYCGVTRTTTGF